MRRRRSRYGKRSRRSYGKRRSSRRGRAKRSYKISRGGIRL